MTAEKDIARRIAERLFHHFQPKNYTHEGWIASTEREIRAELAPLLAERDALRLVAEMDSAVGIDEDDGSLYINMNDVFAFALADCEEVSVADLPLVHAIWSEYGRDGLEAWVCLRRDEREPHPDGTPWLPFVDQGNTEYPARIEAMKPVIAEMTRAARGGA